MNDPCSAEGTECDYPGGGACEYVAICTSGVWVTDLEAATMGLCNPPNPCPTQEPAPLSMCTISDAIDPPPNGCRYPHGSCFTYWTCDIDTKLFGSSAPPTKRHDGCCPTDAPDTGAPCDEEGVFCTFAASVFECSGGAWKSGG